jgi:acetyltransferase-like isoleucine patch superfamily enzyme
MLGKLVNRLAYAFLYKPRFATRDVKIGKHVSFGKNVVFNCRKIRVGDGTIFQDNIVVNADVFEIGDYGTIYRNCFFPGPGELRIGHNFWLGAGAIVDCQGGTIIGNNVGVGPQSQLWTHMKYGDVMYGCRFHSTKPLIIEDDVWIVGHCLVSPVRIGTRSMAMLGALVTNDMEPDRTYAGVPARDITEKVGKQIEPSSTEQRSAYMEKRIREFAENRRINRMGELFRVVSSPEEMQKTSGNVTVFNIANRTYQKCGSYLEYQFIRFLLPDAKFIPVR